MAARTSRAAAIALLLCAGSAVAADAALAAPAETLEQLLEQTRTVRQRESAEHRQREQTFLRRHDQQRALLDEARAEQRAQARRADELAASFDANEQRLAALQAELDAKAGTLGEMFGVVRQAAADTASTLRESLITAQHPQRLDVITGLSQQTALPDIEALEGLWYEMLREMTETGRVVRFSAPLVAADGAEGASEVVRIGSFTAVADGHFLGYLPDSRKLYELSRQPPRRYLGRARALERADDGYVGAVIDPTRGLLLSTMVRAPDLGDQIRAGGLVGYTIMVLALVGFGIAGYLFVTLGLTRRRVEAQKRQLDTPGDDNPLGRVLKVYHDDRTADLETLEKRLDEAVLRETPALERGLPALKVLAAVGPLLGLLGTVTGMIITFRQITLFGTGDPQLMAAGISQALVTTVQGLVMAIPLVLMHTALKMRSKALVHVLDEESAGIIAEHIEQHGSGARDA